MNEALPERIVARVEQLGRDVVAWAETHRGGSLAEQERGVLELIRGALPDLLEAVLAVSTRGLQPPEAQWWQCCPACGERTRVQSWRPREVLTICGPVRFERPWHVCRGCRQGFSPVDATLGLASRARLSAGVQAWVVELGAKLSFAEAAGLLDELTGLAMAPETVRQHTERVGAELETAQQAAMVEVVRTREPAEAVEPAPGTLVVETDGVMVRYLDGWHEVKLGLVGGQVDGKLEATSFIAARASGDEFGRRLLAEAARRGALDVVAWEGPVTRRSLAVLRKVVVLGDGAVWIWNLAAEHFGERIEIVDYYHASEHVWALAKAFYGDGSAKGKRWAERHCRWLLARGAGPLRRALRAIKRCPPEAAEVLRRERGYFRTNAGRMDYPTFRQQGLPIGSGAIESEAKRLVQQRLKRPGARWSEAGAQAVLNVRSRMLSGLPLAC